jgi:hypothetical protein
MCDRRAFAGQIDESAAGLGERLIALTGVRQADHVIVAGRGVLPIFLELCGRDFLCACCKAGAAPHIAGDPAASIWVLNVRNEDELLVQVTNLIRDLRPNGIVVVGLSALTSLFPFRLRRLLLESGFAAVNQRAVLIDGKVYLLAGKDAETRAKAA